MQICAILKQLCALDRQVLKAVQLRHPAAAAGADSGSFVPNDVCLGASQPPFILLTGPNMGGKSTLLRQVNRLTHS